MIINIAGTGGSGKSTLVRRIMELYDEKIPKYVDGRKQPVYYTFKRYGATMKHTDGRDLMVLGHYETACGGCDTLASFTPTMDFIYNLIRKSHSDTMDVLYEGMIVGDDVKRVIALRQDLFPVFVANLDVPLETCLESIMIRRRAKNPDAKQVNPKSTTGRHKSIGRRTGRLKEAGVMAEFLGREEAFKTIVALLNLQGREANARHL